MGETQRDCWVDGVGMEADELTPALHGGLLDMLVNVCRTQTWNCGDDSVSS